MKNKYLKKDMYLQEKDTKLLMNWDWYNSVIMENQETAEATSDLIGNKITKV